MPIYIFDKPLNKIMIDEIYNVLHFLMQLSVGYYSVIRPSTILLNAHCFFSMFELETTEPHLTCLLVGAIYTILNKICLFDKALKKCLYKRLIFKITNSYFID